MKPSLIRTFAVVAALAMAGWPQCAGAAEPAIDINRGTDGVQLIPIALTGFSGEAAAVLKFDLEVMGCRIAEPDKAKYQVSSTGEGNVQGTLTDRGNGAVLLSKIYQGGNTRAQAHALADDVILRIGGGAKGIAQTKIAFKGVSGGKSEIWVADYDGHNAQTVTRDGVIVAAPAWVPGQFRLLYTSYKDGNPDVFSHDLSTGNRQPVARFSGLNTSAAISPDGRKVAMILSKSGSPDLYVANLDGSDLTQLTSTREDESSPCWSPDGQQICYASREGGRPALYVISASGGNKRRLATLGVTSVTEPDWSPDGKTIAFTAMMSPFQVCTVPAAGGTATVFTAGEDPSWAPNSRILMFTRRTGTSSALSLLDVLTKQTKDVARVSGNNSQPTWRR